MFTSPASLAAYSGFSILIALAGAAIGAGASLRRKLRRVTYAAALLLIILGMVGQVLVKVGSL